MAGKFKVRLIAGHEPVPTFKRFIDQDDSSTYKLNWTETHTIWSTFLGSMQEAHMGATCVLPSVASLTGRAVSL